LKISAIDESSVKEYKKFLMVLNNEATYLLYDKCMRILDVIALMDKVVEMRMYLKECMNTLMSNSKNNYQCMKINIDSLEA
jgi:hypothetical protein